MTPHRSADKVCKIWRFRSNGTESGAKAVDVLVQREIYQKISSESFQSQCKSFIFENKGDVTY